MADMDGTGQGRVLGRGRGRGRIKWTTMANESAAVAAAPAAAAMSKAPESNPPPPAPAASEKKEFNYKGMPPLPKLDRFLEIPPIPRENDQVLEPTDVEFLQGEIFGHNEAKVREANPLAVVLPQEIKFREGRYCIDEVLEEEKSGVVLPEDVKIHIQILCVDDEDVFHARPFVEEEPKEQNRGPVDIANVSVQRIWTVGKIQNEMEKYYEKGFNRKIQSYGFKDWVPKIGEVVAVDVIRKLFQVKDSDRFHTQNEYHRAQVLEVHSDGLTVELLDDYGSGRVLKEQVFKIRPQWTELPPQVFKFELAGMQLFNCRKIIHQVLQETPIPDMAPNAVDTVFIIKFDGQFSKKKLPLVDAFFFELKVKKRILIPLKDYVLKNCSHILSPFNNLVQGNTACRILQIDSKANMLIQFRKDADIRRRMNCFLDDKFQEYESYVKSFGFTKDDLIDGETDGKKNSKRIYVTLLRTSENSEETCLRRVKIVGSFKNTNDKVLVTAIDYCAEHAVEPGSLVPLASLSRDLCYLPPMMIRAHLNFIKKIDLNVPEVKRLLFEDEIRVALVYEWPGADLRPEVTVSVINTNEDEMMIHASYCKKTAGFGGLGQLFVANGWAEKFTEKETLDVREAAEANQPRGILREVAKTSNTFVGESFQFF